MRTFLALAATCALATGAQAHDMNKMAADASPQQILQKLHLTNLHEIKAAKLAQTNGTDKVQDYARTLLNDHQDADSKVMALAQKKGFTLSDQPTTEHAMKHEQMKDELTNLKGAQFDKTFADAMYKGHSKVLAMAQMWTQNCKDQDVCSLVKDLTPTLQKHEQMAESLKGPMPQGRTPAPAQR